MNARAKQLADLGRKALQGGDMIDAIAVMLSAPPKRAKDSETPKLPFSPGELHRELQTRVGHLVLCEPVESRLFGYLGKRLQQVTGLERADMDRLVSWIEAGGLSFWTVKPTFDHVCKHIGKWLTTAREWDRLGRQNLRRGGSNVGSETAVVRDVDSMFK